MSGRLISCTQCRNPLPEPFLLSQQDQPCPICGAKLEVTLFPARFRAQMRGQTSETILIEGEASCFYHPQKRASIPCDACGRFLCAVCDVELNGRHLCPSCLEAGRQQGQLPELENRRMLFDSGALNLALLTTLLGCLWPFWIVTGLTAIALAIFSWFRPSSVIPRTRFRAIAAIVLGLLQVTFWVLMIFTGFFNL